jgi:hypothetical protein
MRDLAIRAAGTGGAAEVVREPAGEVRGAPASGMLHGAAFVLLCLWTRTSPERLRDQLRPEAGACATLGF